MIIKIISLNTWWGGELLPNMLEFLKEQDADILCLQEVYNSIDPSLEDRHRSVDIIKKRLGYEYSDFAQAFIHDGPAGMHPTGNAVVSKLPLIDRNSIFFTEPTQESYQDVPELWPVEPRVLQHVVLQGHGNRINVFNMHGVWDLDGDNYSQARKDMRDKILKAAEGLDNVIITGDTNAKSTNQAMLDLERYYPAVFDKDLQSTFNMRRKDNPGYASAAVDLMYTSNKIKIISKSVPNVDVSDHLPIVVELEIPDQSPVA